MVGVVVNVSAAVLARRAVASAADGVRGAVLAGLEQAGLGVGDGAVSLPFILPGRVGEAGRVELVALVDVVIGHPAAALLALGDGVWLVDRST